MKIGIPVYVFTKLGLPQGDDDEAMIPLFEDLIPKYSYDQSEIYEIETNRHLDEHLDAIIKFLNEDIDIDKTQLPGVKTSTSHIKWQKKYTAALNKFKRWKRLLEAGDDKVFRSLTGIPSLMEGYLKKLPNSRFYEIDSYDQLIAWVLIDCKHVPADRQGNQAHVSFEFAAYKNGENVKKSFYVEMADVGNGMTITNLLEIQGMFPENEDYNTQYDELIIKMGKQIDDFGNVYVGSGVAEKKSERYYSAGRYFFKEAESCQVVMDHQGPHIEDSSKSEKILSINHQISSRITAQYVDLPVHPFVNVFHLEEHIWLAVHVDGLEPYEFVGESIIDKLILPPDHKRLIRILMNMSKINIEDIIKGKKGGSFIMATGLPGTGKTLTAEVFSEVIKKPLYKVQCSQLGLSVEKVESNLKKVLERASRWGAILLIDESDVYVRSRGLDLQQNAIVGVFLRTLEYYPGILFMTSNLETQIDDAIMSRATAHLKYESPSTNDLRKIWIVLSKQFNIDLDGDMIESLLVHFPNIVGRDIKALLKLAKMYSEDTDTPCTHETILDISGFVPNVLKTKNTHEQINS